MPSGLLRRAARSTNATPCVSAGNNFSTVWSGTIVCAGIVIVAITNVSAATTETPTIHFISIILSGEVHDRYDVAHKRIRERCTDDPPQLQGLAEYQTPHCANSFSRLGLRPVQRTENLPIKFIRK